MNLQRKDEFNKFFDDKGAVALIACIFMYAIGLLYGYDLGYKHVNKSKVTCKRCIAEMENTIPQSSTI